MTATETRPSTTLDEFVEQYGFPGRRVPDLLARGYVVDPCACGDDCCRGWVVVPSDCRHPSMEGKPPALA